MTKQRLLLCSALYSIGHVAFAFTTHSFPAPRVPPRRPLALTSLSSSSSSSNQAPSLLFQDQVVAPAIVQACRGKQKVTAAEVASTTGISLSTARRQLTLLAAQSASDIAVDGDGQLYYSFDSSLEQKLASNSARYKIAQQWQRAWPSLFWFLRVLFGVTLVASLVVIFSAICFLQTSDRDDRRGNSRGFGNDRGPSFGGGGGYYNHVYGQSPFDVFYWNRPYGYYSQPNKNRNKKMGFLTSVYSYVFGDGDPNSQREETRLKLAADTIRKAGGAVTAEQLAPFCDDLPAVTSHKSTTVDESYVLPIVSALDGEPQVTDDGNIVYVFEELSEARPSGASVTGMLEETELQLSIAPKMNRVLAAGLGVVNLGGALYLGQLLTADNLYEVQLPSYLGLVQTFYPFLLGYAVLFNAIPAVRAVYVKRKNAEIRERNSKRSKWKAHLREDRVARKWKAAADFGRKLKLGKKPKDTEIVFDTSAPSEQNQQLKVQQDLDDFDKLLNDTESGNFQ